MSDPTLRPDPADQATDEVMTDEQIWDDFAEKDGDAAQPRDVDQSQAEDFPDPSTDGQDPEPLDPEPAPAKAGTPAPDGTAGMDPVQLQAHTARLEQLVKTERGRVATLRREIETLRAQRAEASPSRKSLDKTLTDKLAKAREEYGDVVAPVADMLDAVRAEVSELTTSRNRDLAATQRRVDEGVQAEQATFMAEHPDGFDVIVAHRRAFDDWIEDQPKALRDIYATNREAIVDGTGAALLVARFKQALVPSGSNAPASRTPSPGLPASRQRQLDGARSPRATSATRAAAAPDPNSDDPAAHWDYFERMDRERLPSR